MTGSAFEFDLQHLLAEEGYVRRLARGLLFDEHRVDDVVQQTWIAALHNPPTGPGALRAWLSGVVRRVVANEVRSDVRRERRERAAAAVEEPAPSADEVLAREERRHEIVEVLQRLPEPYRTAVALRYLEGLEPVEIARRLEVPAATVRTHVRRGLEQMREHLDRRHGGDRIAWCAALLPLARGRDAAAAGMATTLVTTSALAMKKLLFAGVLACAALLTYALWPGGGAPVPVDSAVAAPSPRGAAVAGGSLPEVKPEQRTEVRTESTATRAAAWAGGLRGRLVGPDGAPLAGARIDGFAFDGTRLFGGDVDLPSASARTGADGTFVLDGLPLRARCAMVADADGELRQLVPLSASPELAATVDLGDVRLEARAAIEGVVVGPDGEALAGAEVWCADLPGLVLAALPVDRLVPEQGALVMVPRPDGEQLADLAKWSDAVRRHLAWGLPDADYGDLPSAGYLPVVLDGSALRPVWDRLPIARTTTGADGGFRLVGVAPGSNVLVARAGRLATAVRPSVLASTRRERNVGTIRLAAGETLRGRVVDPGGEPVAGVEVRVGQVGIVGFRGLAPCEPAVTTDRDGRFAVRGLARGAAVVAFRGAATEPWRVHGPVDVDAPVELTTAPLSVVEIALRLPDGVEPGNVRLLGRPAPPLGELARFGFVEPFGELELARDGARITARLAPGLWTLRVCAPGCAPAVRMVAVPTDGAVEVQLDRAIELAVTVRDARGAPCAGAEVFVQGDGDPDAYTVMASRFGLATFAEPWPQAVVGTDADGRVRIATAAGAVRVSARHGDFGTAEREVDTRSTASVELRLSGGGSVEGVLAVGSSHGGDPRAFRIVADPRGFAETGGPVRTEATARPDVAGRIRFDGLPPGRYDVAVFDPLPASLTFAGLVAFLEQNSNLLFGNPAEIESTTVEVTADAVAHVALAVGGLDRSQGSVSGRVSIDGLPAEGCTIWARERTRDGEFTFDAGWEGRARATVDSDGTFVVDDLDPRTWWLGLREGRRGEFVHVFEVDVVAGARTPVEVDLQLGRLCGVVRRADGSPAAGVYVFIGAESFDRMISRGATADERGAFAFDRLPAGRFVLRASDRHLELGDTVVEVLPGTGTPPLDLTGEIRYRVRVRLVGDYERPANGMFGFRIREVGTERSGLHSVDRPDYEFELGAPGDYEVFVRLGGKTFATVPPRVRVDELDSTVELHVGAEVDIK